MGSWANKSIFVVLGALLLFLILEWLFPLRSQSRNWLQRIKVNLVLSLLTYGTVALVVRPITLSALRWGDHRAIGVLHYLPFSPWLIFVVGFLLLDLSFYYWHRLNHRLPFLWRFHNVHHLDPDLDVSTGFRFHFGEVLLSTFFRVTQVLLIGVSFELFAVFELIFQIETYFHHSNLRLPEPVERILNLFIVSPRMHAIHHSTQHEETDSNYSVIFSLWDRLHRSYRWKILQPPLRIGVPGYSEESDNQMGVALMAPFVLQHEYWPKET